ncbi:MAG: SurA N-terminal domain-containing protein [Thermodesulfobacteriota bacterium]
MTIRTPRHQTGLACLIFFLVVVGCGSSRDIPDDYLLRIGNNEVTVRDYLDALEVMKASYPYEALQNNQVITTLKARLLKQLTEELILSRRAKELDLTVTPDELEKAFNEIRKDYPEGAFETTLLEKAIPLQAWKKRVEMRLLTEKVIDKELVAGIKLTPEEVSQAYRGFRGGGRVAPVADGEAPDATFVRYLRREKAQEQYPQWLDTLQQKYTIEFNEARWKSILG